MTTDLYSENKILRRRLEDFMAQAERNEGKLRRFQAHELRLISLNSLFELIQDVLYPDQTVFSWDMVALLLLDPEYEVRRILKEEGVDLKDHPALMFAAHPDDLDSLFPFSLFPLLGPYRAKQHAALFPHVPRPPASIALLPLVRHGKLIGSLNIGSLQPERFVKGVRTDFLEHLAAIVAICVENSTNLERLKRQGLTDTLTAVNNRRFFDQRLTEEMELAARSQAPLSCLLLDVDHFKRVNDTYGHQTGDVVLKEVAALIRAQLRGSDVLSRYGGEEFAALLMGASQSKATEVAERVRQSIAVHPFKLPNGAEFGVTISIGIATYTPSPVGGKRPSGEVLVGHADRALYDAKAGGRNRVVAAGDLQLETEEWF